MRKTCTISHERPRAVRCSSQDTRGHLTLTTKCYTSLCQFLPHLETNETNEVKGTPIQGMVSPRVVSHVLIGSFCHNCRFQLVSSRTESRVIVQVVSDFLPLGIRCAPRSSSFEGATSQSGHQVIQPVLVLIDSTQSCVLARLQWLRAFTRKSTVMEVTRTNPEQIQTVKSS